MTFNLGYFSDTYHPQFNGVVTSIDSFKKELELRGNEIFIFAPRDTVKKTTIEKNIFRFKSISYPFYKEYQITWPYTRQLKIIDSLNLDIYHIHSPFSMGLLALYLAKQKKTPVIMTYHTAWVEYTHYIPLPEQSIKSFAIWMSKKFCDRLDILIVPSNAMKIEVEKYNLNTEIITIPTGFSLPENIQPIDLHKKYNIKKSKKLLLFAGRIGNEKNVHLLIDAFKIVLNTQANTHLVMIGDGPEKKACEDKCKNLNISADVTFTGRYTHRQVLEALINADLFVFPSISETQGLVVLEALACSIPTIAVNKMGSIDYLHDKKGGLLTENNPHDFAKGICSVLTIKDPTLLKEEAKKKANQYSIKEVTNKLLNTYETVYENHKKTKKI
jgi:1,2-diacylglycerol 3-alpha-glucosyltransferase